MSKKTNEEKEKKYIYELRPDYNPKTDMNPFLGMDIIMGKNGRKVYTNTSNPNSQEFDSAHEYSYTNYPHLYIKKEVN